MLGLVEALITLGGVVGAALIAGPVMWALKRIENKNTSEHAQTAQMLGRIEGKVDSVVTGLESHLQWHMEQGPTAAPVNVVQINEESEEEPS